MEAYQTVSVKDCLGWVKHFESYWGLCLDEELVGLIKYECIPFHVCSDVIACQTKGRKV